MKIFNIENGVKKVYVQMNDIIMLNHTAASIPASIFEKVFSDVVIVDDSNRMDFVEFTKPNEIKFFESLDWIVDYKKVRDFKEEEIKEKGQEIANEMNRIAEKYNSMNDKQKEKNQSLMLKHELLKYKMNSLAEILWVKQGHITMPFPIVPDSDGFSFVGNDQCEHEIRASLDPNKILLYRKDGKKLSKDEKIPRGFVQMGISIALMEKGKTNEFFGNYEMSNSLSEDSQYFITEFKVRSYDETPKEEKQPEEKQPEEKGIKGFVKRLFNKKR